jgi:hypothetical protein
LLTLLRKAGKDAIVTRPPHLNANANFSGIGFDAKISPVRDGREFTQQLAEESWHARILGIFASGSETSNEVHVAGIVAQALIVVASKCPVTHTPD